MKKEKTCRTPNGNKYFQEKFDWYYETRLRTGISLLHVGLTFPNLPTNRGAESK